MLSTLFDTTLDRWLGEPSSFVAKHFTRLEDKEGCTFAIELPGMDTLDVSFDNKYFTITGTRNNETSNYFLSLLDKEIKLLDMDKVEAIYKRGVLSIRVPIKEQQPEKKPKTITVQMLE